jgi:hypothetical protein
MVQCNGQIQDLSIHTTPSTKKYRLHNSERTRHPQDSHDTLQYASREPEYFGNNLDHAHKQSNNKETIPMEKERLFITNTNKGHKVTDLTRPNELSTTTSKATTKNTDKTQLWK